MSTLTYEDNGLAISVTPDRQVFGERWSYQWRILDSTAGEEIATGSDLETPFYDPIGALASLASFLDAWCEAQSYPNSENRDLFPASILDRVDASTLGDWAGMAHLELTESERV